MKTANARRKQAPVAPTLTVVSAPRPSFKQNQAARDYAAMLALSDARKASIAASRAAAQANSELCAYLLTEARRRGQSEIDWNEYFRNSGLV